MLKLWHDSKQDPKKYDEDKALHMWKTSPHIDRYGEELYNLRAQEEEDAGWDAFYESVKSGDVEVNNG